MSLYLHFFLLIYYFPFTMSIIFLFLLTYWKLLFIIFTLLKISLKRMSIFFLFFFYRKKSFNIKILFFLITRLFRMIVRCIHKIFGDCLLLFFHTPNWLLLLVTNFAHCDFLYFYALTNKLFCTVLEWNFFSFLLSQNLRLLFQWNVNAVV